MHDVRRTVDSWLAQAGKSLHLIDDVLNHRDPKTTAGYAYFQTQQRREAHLCLLRDKDCRNYYGFVEDVIWRQIHEQQVCEEKGRDSSLNTPKPKVFPIAFIRTVLDQANGK